MNDTEALLRATSKYHATDVKRFRQADARQYCNGWVALWIRKRSVGKDIYALQKKGEEGATYLDRDDKSELFVEGPYGKVRSRVLHELLRDAQGAEMVPGHHLKGNEEHEYITKGSRGEKKLSLEKVKEWKGNLSGESKLQKGEPWDDCEGLWKAIHLTKTPRGLASLALSTRGGSHAIAFDFSAKDFMFFDPLLGQLSFPNEQHLFNWWREFFNKRLDDPSCAFYGLSKAEFAITVYRKTGG